MTKYFSCKAKKQNGVIAGFNFPAGKLNVHNDTFVENSRNLKEFDFLCFFDSRGSTLDNNKSKTFSGLLIDYFRSINKTFVIICRPLEVTVFFSLFNFLYSNDTKAQNLITNMGFVDFTPKKREITEDTALQKELLFDDIKCLTKNLGKYRLSNGSQEILKYIDINPCADTFSKFLEKQFKMVYLLETPEFKPECTFPRERPASFFKQLTETNLFINKMSSYSNKVAVVSSPVISDNYLDFSYDGVHFTDIGHRKQFEVIMSNIESLD